MTENEIEKLFDEQSINEITKSFTKSKLNDMYMTIFKAKPLSANRKENTVRDMKAYFDATHRTKSIHEAFSK